MYVQYFFIGSSVIIIFYTKAWLTRNFVMGSWPSSKSEIVLFNVNEVIGRTYLGTVDAGDTIFVHMFGAYFGLAASRYVNIYTAIVRLG
jgi:hypothetical protein